MILQQTKVNIDDIENLVMKGDVENVQDQDPGADGLEQNME